MPYASVCVGKYLESMLSDIPRHPHLRLPDGRLKSRKYKKSAIGGKNSPAAPVEKSIIPLIICRGIYDPQLSMRCCPGYG